MAIPSYEKIMLPFLKYLGDRKEHSKSETIKYLADLFKLTEDELSQLLPSARQRIFDNRVGWARTYLKKAGLIESTKRGHFQITSRGLSVLTENLQEISDEYLGKFPEFNDFKSTTRKNKEEASDRESLLRQTPEESLESAHQKIRLALAVELLSRVKDCSPDFFENLVVELIVRMGYGGSRKDAGQAIGKSGDGGIDGIIKEDKLGLDVIYIQAKRWEGVVGSKEIRNFVGSLVGQKADKGIFITTSGFTKDAISYVTTIQHKVILIDGEQLVQLMIDNGVGVTKIASLDIKRIDSDYFVED